MKIAVAEREVLVRRSASARSAAERAGAGPLLLDLQRVAGATRAVINGSAAFVHHLLSSDEVLYASYQRLLTSGLHRPAQLTNDRDRVTVESKLYGSGGGKVFYAALSVDGHGLVSYGPISLQLREETIEHRASVLEENSYTFAQRHAIQLVGPVPQGYMGTWADRAELAVAKLAPKLTTESVETDLPALFLHSDGSRTNDEFFEVHVWGGFNRAAIDRISLSGPLEEEEDQLLAELAEEKARRYAIPWSPS